MTWAPKKYLYNKEKVSETVQQGLKKKINSLIPTP